MYYRLKTSLTFNYPVDVVLDKALSDSLKSGIASISSENRFYATVTFNNGVVFNYWNEGKYYAWLSRGSFKFPDGTKYTFDDARPTAKTMYKMRKALANFNFSYHRAKSICEHKNTEPRMGGRAIYLYCNDCKQWLSV